MLLSVNNIEKAPKQNRLVPTVTLLFNAAVERAKEVLKNYVVFNR